MAQRLRKPFPRPMEFTAREVLLERYSSCGLLLPSEESAVSRSEEPLRFLEVLFKEVLLILGK
jgi:hypothetical protein